MNNLIPINYDGSDRPTVSGRDLHNFLEVGTAYKDWFPRMCEYGFTEGTDYRSFLSESTGGRPAQNHQLTIDMAKELCMLQRTEKGKIARQYFIELEKQWNSPEAVMSRALRMAEQKLKDLSVINSKLVVENQIMVPKAEYFDELVDRNLLTNFRETAKQLQIKEKDFVTFLLDKKYVYRDKRGKLMPYADKKRWSVRSKRMHQRKNKLERNSNLDYAERPGNIQATASKCSKNSYNQMNDLKKVKEK